MLTLDLDKVKITRIPGEETAGDLKELSRCFSNCPPQGYRDI